jgi:hypothetical protein
VPLTLTPATFGGPVALGVAADSPDLESAQTMWHAYTPMRGVKHTLCQMPLTALLTYPSVAFGAHHPNLCDDCLEHAVAEPSS